VSARAIYRIPQALRAWASFFLSLFIFPLALFGGDFGLDNFTLILFFIFIFSASALDEDFGLE
jgi:hypothetical protein